MAAFDESLVKVENCEAARNKVAGYWAQGSAKIVLDNCSSESDMKGCGANGGVIIASQLVVRRSDRHGLDFGASAHAILKQVGAVLPHTICSANQ